jgi:hypothetical protein
VAEPNVAEDFNRTTYDNGDAHRSEWVAHMAQAGDYTITTNGKVTPYVSPRLSFGHQSRFGFLTRLFVGLFVACLAALLLTATLPREASERERARRLIEEAGVSRARRQTMRVVGRTLQVLAALAIAVFFAGVVVNEGLVWIGGLALFGGSIVLMIPLARANVRKIDKVRWQEGTVTFRTVKPGHDDESGQYVDCEVELNPTGRITQVRSTTGDTRRVVVGATMRCRHDRLENGLVAFPDAEPDAPLPAGKILRFRDAPVHGTGQVLSVQRKGLPFSHGENGPRQVRCQIAVRVQLPGRPPYDATILQLVDTSAMPNLQPGVTVVVAADSANPQNVRIDVTRLLPINL